MAENKPLTDAEAREFHAQFRLGTITFGLVAAIAHLLIALWRPWFPGKHAADLVNQALTLIG